MAMMSYSARRGTYASPEVMQADELTANGASRCRETRHLRTLSGHTGSISGVCVVGDYVITGSTDGTVRFWRQSDGTPEGAVRCKAAVRSLAHVRMTQRQHLLLIGCCQGDVELFRGTLDRSVRLRQVGSYPFHAPNPITTLVVSPDQHLIASATCFRSYVLECRTLTRSTLGGVKIWKLADLLDYANDDVTGNGGQPIARVSRTARQLGAEAARLLRVSGSSLDRRVEDFGVTSATYTPDSAILIVGFGLGTNATVTWAKTVVFCDVDKLSVLHVFDGMTSQIRHLGAVPAICLQSDAGDVIDVAYVFVQTSTGVMKLKQVRRERDAVSIHTNVEWSYTEFDKNRICCGMAISPDATVFVSAHASIDVDESRRRYVKPTLAFLDVVTGELMTSYDVGPEGAVSPRCFSTDGSVLYATASDRTLNCFRSPRHLAPVQSPAGQGRHHYGSDVMEGNGARTTANAKNASPSPRKRFIDGDVCTAHALPSPETRHRCSSSNCFDLFGATSRSLIGQSERKDSFDNLLSDSLD